MDDKLRPVLEALRDAARWMRVEVTNEHEAHAAACKQRVAWLDLEGCCAQLLTAALASDAERQSVPEADTLRIDWLERAVPTGAFARLAETRRGLWNGSFREWIDAAMVDDAAVPAADAGTAVEQADERQLLEALGKAAAPDAELEELFGRHKCTFIESPKLRAAIHAHVEKVKREARGEVVASGYLHKNADEKFARVFSEKGEELGVAAGWLPVDLVRRREKKGNPRNAT